MYRLIGWLSGTVMLAAAVQASPPQVPGGDLDDRRTARPPKSAPALLAQRLPEISFEEAPLNEVLASMGEMLNTNVVARWSRLAEVGVEPDTPVTLRVRNLRVGQVLWLILSEAAGSDVRLAYRAEPDLILISTAEDFGRQMITRVYDVRHLLVPRLVHPSIQIGREQTFISAVQPVVAEGAVGVRPIPQVITSGVTLIGEDAGGTVRRDDDTGSFQEQRLRELIDAITTTIEPETWLVNGGRGSIVPYNGMLIIRNSPLVHQKIAGPVEEGGPVP